MRSTIVLFAAFALGLSARASITETRDDFDTGIGDWVHVGSVTEGSIAWKVTSEKDWYDGDDSTYIPDYAEGMEITGDGRLYDGGLCLDTFNATKGDEAMGLTIGGTMGLGEVITFSGNLYNDENSYTGVDAQLWNLTDNVLLADTGNILVRNYNSPSYSPMDFSVEYTAQVSDVGDTLQIRFVDSGGTHTARNIFVDAFSVVPEPMAPARATYPWGNKFWFSFYSTRSADSVYAVERGATGIGPYYNTLDSQVAPLAEAHELGVGFSYKVVLPSMAGFSPHNDDFVWPSDATLVAETIEIVSAVADNLDIVMWDLVPEELRYWEPKEKNLLEKVADTIRQTDPLDRPVMMYEPNHRSASDLAQTVPYQEISAKGTYLSTDSDLRHNRIWARWSMEQELAAIAAANTNAVPWIMLWMAADAAEGEEHLIEDWCRHDAYMGLIMGGKGISIWSGWRPRAGFENDFQAYFDGYLSVATDLNLGRNLAPVFLHGTESAGVTHNVTAGPIELELEYPSGTTHHYPPVTYTMREFLGQHYLFMVNSATQAVTLTFSGVPDAPRTDLFQETEYPASGGAFSIALAPYEVAGFRFDNYEAWRAEHFPASGDDGETDDPDHDNRTNRDEFNAGTDPNNGTDFFQTDLTISNGRGTVSFNTVGSRFYTVDLSTNLAEGLWVPVLGNEWGTGGDLSATDTNDHSSTFYRIQVARP